ncbi:MAG TPA: hypothetical protein VJ914_34115 [Pseudonocardiaceae bacterium]|nr:hypothetical protein [Pseudonocardiaceae bacterium]
MDRLRPGAGRSQAGAIADVTGEPVRARPDRLVSEDEPAGPVFLDASGRRRRAVRGLAVLTGCAALGSIALLTAALLGAPVGPSALFPNGDLAVVTTSATAPPAISTGGPDTSAVSAATAASSNPVRVTTTPTGARTAISTHTALPTTTTAAPVTTATLNPTKNVPPGKPTGLPTPPGHIK